MINIEQDLRQIVINEVEGLGRSDLFREPLVAFSDANDKRYDDLKRIIGDWHLSAGEILEGAKSVISFFVPFMKDVVMSPKNSEGPSRLWGEAYQMINLHSAHINKALTKYLSEFGYNSTSIPATHAYDPKDMKTFWSHKSAAHIAGLGVFGKNRILITEKGSGGRFGTLLTTAPLKATQSLPAVQCLDSCGLCHKICPVGAFSGSELDKHACQNELFKNGEILRSKSDLTKADACGKCISICPVAYVE